MRNSSNGGRLWWTAVVAAVLAAAALGQEYIDADVKIQGKEIHSFTDGSENVTVVLGDFKLTVAGRAITGRDAVLWVRTGQGERTTLNDITVYVEGEAKIVEPGGAVVTDRVLLATVANKGRIGASGTYSDRPLIDFPLYRRALKARRDWQGRAGRLDKAGPSASRPAPKGPATRPAAAGPAPGRPGPKGPADREVQPVNFSADSVNYKRVGQRWVTIAHGNVYLSQGHPDSDEFLELRSQAAVIFIEADVSAKQDVRSGYAVKLPRMNVAGQERSVTGAYLEGDVVIAQGERFFRGPAAYYDFTTNRAIVVEPVFRTVQKQRNIPIYIRASQARILSEREAWFANAEVSTSEFYTPTYHVGARRAYLMDTTPYDRRGKRLGEQAWHARLTDTTFNIRGIPVFYAPVIQGDLEQGNSPLRKVQVGKSGAFGWGVETEWHLFRLLGLLKPEGFKGRVELDWLERGVIGGINLSYARENFSGYHLFYGVYDDDGKDDFGTERENIRAGHERGRVLMRHKQFLPGQWQLQFELSYVCDRNFLEQFFPNEFYAGKEQETLLYAKKQKDNWAFTSLLQTRLNRFDTQAESAPDLGFYLIGEPLLGDRLTFFHESRAGLKRFSPANWTHEDRSSWFVRLDTRDQVDLPLHVGPINLVPYAVGRATYWGDEPDPDETRLRLGDDPFIGAEHCRPYGQVGARANTHVWAVYNDVQSRLWDLNRLKHIITPEVTGWIASSHGVYPAELFPMDPDVEQHLDRTSGAAFNVYQRLQTKRGPAADQRTVDWMRLNLSLGIYDNHRDTVPSDGRFFWYQPEYSLGRNHLNAEYFWQISDATLLLADANYDMDDQRLARGNIGLAVTRDPRLRYYCGMRYIDDLDSAVGTFGVNYKINRKYSVSAFEQYDFAFNGGRNLSSGVTIVRKLPRWYSAFTFSYETTTNEVTMLVTFWPEGVEEVRIGGSKLTLLGRSDKN